MAITIDRAIQILTEALEPGIFAYDEEDLDAIKLGVEALKHIQDLRFHSPVDPWRELPGEARK